MTALAKPGTYPNNFTVPRDCWAADIVREARASHWWPDDVMQRSAVSKYDTSVILASPTASPERPTGTGFHQDPLQAGNVAFTVEVPPAKVPPAKVGLMGLAP